MTDLVFDCLGVEPDRYAAFPTLLFHLKVSETTRTRVHAIALRCQMRIEPVKRQYSQEEAEGLLDLFGERHRWGETLKPMQFTTLSINLRGFDGSLEFDLPVQCTYDLEVAASKYFNALRGGEIPLLLLFSGTVFSRGETGYTVEQVPWHKETTCRLPVVVWRELMDLYFPNSGWLRINRETLDALLRFKSRRALPTWEQTFEILLKEAGEELP